MATNIQHPHHPTISPKTAGIDQDSLQSIYKYLNNLGFDSGEVDLKQIHLRPAFQPITTLGLTLVFYFVLVLFGIIGNIIILGIIIRKKLLRQRSEYKLDNTHICVLNLTVGFLLQLAIVVPLTLFVIVVHNWVLGPYICYALPILQDIPTYCLTLTMLVLCLDRHQSIRHPEKAPMPITWILGLVWFVSIALVLPYMAYIKHFDLSIIHDHLKGAEICIISLSDTASKYIKVLFVLCYVLPVTFITILLSRTSHHIQRREKAQNERALYRDQNTEDSLNTELISQKQQQMITHSKDTSRRSSQFTSRTRDSTPASGISTLTATSSGSPPQHLSQVASTALILDTRKEKRSLRFLVGIVTIYFSSLLPLNVLKIVRQVVTETYQNEDHFDITFIILIWIAFLPTIVVQWFVAHWLLIGGGSGGNTNLNRTTSTTSRANRSGNYDNIHQDTFNTNGNYVDNNSEQQLPQHLLQPRRISTSNNPRGGGGHHLPQSHQLEVATSAGPPPPAPSITCSGSSTSRSNVKNGVETIMVHDLTARRSHSNHQQQQLRPGGGGGGTATSSNGGHHPSNENSTPAGKRPRAKSTVDSMLTNQEPWKRQIEDESRMFLFPSDDNLLSNSGGRRRSHGYYSHHYQQQQHIQPPPQNKAMKSNTNGGGGTSNVVVTKPEAAHNSGSTQKYHHHHQYSNLLDTSDFIQKQQQRRHSFNVMAVDGDDVPAPPPPPHATNV